MTTNEITHANLTYWAMHCFMTGDEEGLKKTVAAKVKLANEEQGKALRIGVWIDEDEHASMVWYAHAGVSEEQAKKDALANIGETFRDRVRGMRPLAADEWAGSTRTL